MSEFEAPKEDPAAQQAVIDERASEIAINEAKVADKTLELQQQQQLSRMKDFELATRPAEIYSKRLQSRDNAAQALEDEVLKRYEMVKTRNFAAARKEEASKKQLASNQAWENDFVIAPSSLKKEEIQVESRPRNDGHGKRDLSITHESIITNRSAHVASVYEKELDISETTGWRQKIEQMTNDVLLAIEHQSGNLDRREQAFTARSAAFKTQVTALTKREEEVNILEQSIKLALEGRESALTEREENIKERELLVVLLEQTIEQENEKARLRQIALDDQQEWLEIDEESLMTRLSILENREHAIETRESSLILREATLSAREEAVSVHETELGPREMDVQRREKVFERFADELWNIRADRPNLD
jgi:hypothetical protein